MSEKSKKPATKKTTAKKPAAKSTAKKAPSKKSPPKKTTTATKKKPTTTAKPRSRKLKIIKAQILSYRRNNRLQTTNQAIAKILDDCNHKTLIGKKFVLEFPDSEAIAKGVVTGIHGKSKSRLVRIRFDNAGMSGYALNLIGDIHI
ncbi:MAG: hypothetical protein KAJ76_02740 [Candidatus Heimdallarchaeota archaeon]|nr:hypothetical protein [Candidatus Heimdallarchaeota archaeon]MCK5297796.1 hypothetical protein [Candidatus Heimdallarchaeota archaeon]